MQRIPFRKVCFLIQGMLLFLLFVSSNLIADEITVYNLSDEESLSMEYSTQESDILLPESGASCADSQYGSVKILSIVPKPGTIVDRNSNIVFSGKVQYALSNVNSGRLYIAFLPFPLGSNCTCYQVIQKTDVTKSKKKTISFTGTVIIDRNSACGCDEPTGIDSITVKAFMFPEGFSCTSIGAHTDPYPVSDPQSLDQTDSGFYYPLGTAEFDSRCGTWLARDKENGGCYFAGKYHIGVDMMAEVGSLVYPISNGKIVKKSTGNWGTGNVGVFVQHALSDGSKILALYGHVRMLNSKQKEVTAGTPFATIGPYSNGNHLHFGIVPSSEVPPAPFGIMPNSSWPSTNGFVNPVDFISTHSPD